MEQTVNQFNKGLLMDTHPMVLGNDVLSDCLNGTLITMNSNEVVLQNDMGNAKIDNAYLPPGYLPVGMKEYGGIIYVAAYNPITNKSLIGSFPSPERKISVEDKDLGNTIDLDKNFSNELLEGINFLNNDILLIPLTSDTSLHAGDKFTVYSSYIWLNKNNITNFDNIILYQLCEDFLGEGNTYEDKIENLKEQLNNTIPDSDKEKINHNIRIYLKLSEGKNLCYSPKNKKYTLSLGILNSLNEFVDITKSLVRWKDIDGKRPIKEENESDSAYNKRLKTYRESIKPIEFTNESDLLRFNTGYFIAKDFVDPLEEYAGNDKKLIAERLKMAINSYAYKLIGPLYLKAELNHIKNFDFSIEGTKIPGSTTDAEILIRATITYNCPDGINTTSKGDDNYFDYFLGKLENESAFPGFHLYKKSENTYIRLFTDSGKDKYYNNPETKYNPETNLYEVTIEKKYTIKSTSDNKYEYYVCVPSGYKSKDGDDVYIKGLSTKGEIDFTKLGSGTLEVNLWRFYNTMPTENTEGSTLLTYGFSAYPRIGHTFSDLEIKLSCSLVGLLIDTNDISGLKSIDEKRNINISWEGLSPRTLYDVIITYKEKDENDLYIQENGSDKVFTINNEWILTTELFNNCYSTNSLDFVDDYAKFNNLGENLPNGLKYLVNKLLTVKLDINENIKYTLEESSDYSGFEKLISKNSSSENIESSVINKYKFNFILNRPSINISNEILYPAYINNEIISDFLGEISFNKSIDEASIQKNIYEYQSGTVSPFVNIVTNVGSIPEEFGPFNFGENIINMFNFTTNITQKIESKLTLKSINIENCFSSFDTVFSEKNNNNFFSPYCCFGAKCPKGCGGKSPAILMYLILYSTPDHIANENIENSNQNWLLFEMDCHSGDQIDVHKFSTYFDRISEFFNKNHENSQFIVGITNYHEAHGNSSINGINAANTLNYYNGNHEDSGNNIFIAWIRTNNGWIPFHIEDVTLNNNINFKEKIKSSEYYDKNLKYFHTNFKSSPQSIDLYTIDLDESYHYISPYNFSFPIKYTIKAVAKNDNDIIIKIGSNLKFKILKENTLDNNISIKYKSNLNFDNTIKLAIQASLGEGLYSYDIDLDTMEDSEHNILRPEVNYIEIDSKLVKDFEGANNIKVFSENDGIKTFSFPNKTINLSLTDQTTYPSSINTQYAAHAESGREGLSVIGLKFNIGAKKFVTNGG